MDSKQFKSGGMKIRGEPFSSNKERYEVLMQNAVADADGVEKCFSMCRVNFKSPD
jgi:hypothetical protein